MLDRATTTPLRAGRVGALAMLAAISLPGCASSPEPQPDAEEIPVAAESPPARPTADPDEVISKMDDEVCKRDAMVTVRVYNEGSLAVELAFGAYRPARIAEAFERTTYQVPRSYLRNPIALRVARGGLQVGPNPRIDTEPVVCNIATLVIGATPRYSVFYGDVIYEPKDLRAARAAQEAADSAAAADSARAAADSAAKARKAEPPW